MFNKESASDKTETANATIEVLRARQTKKDNLVVFDLKVNEVSIYGCFLKEVTIKKDGKRYKAGDTAYIISFPSYKGTDDKYYNYCYYPLTEQDEQFIIESIKKVLS